MAQNYSHLLWEVTSRYGRYGSEKTLQKDHAFGRDKRDPPGASRSFPEFAS